MMAMRNEISEYLKNCDDIESYAKDIDLIIHSYQEDLAAIFEEYQNSAEELANFVLAKNPELVENYTKIQLDGENPETHIVFNAHLVLDKTEDL